MKAFLKHIFIFFLGAGALGALVMVSGIVPVSSRSGHWPITQWILEFSMGRSISTYSLGIRPPELDKDWMVLKGAGHYEIGCRQCHGVPDIRENLIGRLMTAPAPFLPETLKEWNEKELFTIVKNGVKFTGMPHWPSLERDDEVWSMVAFLRKLPEMNSDQYKALVYDQDESLKLSTMKSVTSADQVLKTCINCHGVNGEGRGNSAFPKIGGQREEYLKRSLQEYKSHKRYSGTMEFVSFSLEEEMIQELSRYYAQKKLKPVKMNPDKADSIERGKSIALNGIPSQRVAACTTCHGPIIPDEKKNPQYPLLAGQYAEYTKLQLDLFFQKKRGKGKFTKVMEKAVESLTEDQKEDVANYYESLNP